MTKSRQQQPTALEETVGTVGITLAIGTLAAALFGTAIVLALMSDTTLAVAFAAVGSLAFACNPVLWASISRARERAKITDDRAGSPAPDYLKSNS